MVSLVALSCSFYCYLADGMRSLRVSHIKLSC